MECKICTGTIQENEKHIPVYDDEYGLCCEVQGVFANYNKLMGGE